ncbi:aspartate aminotransferase family protein [Pontiella agarivorans]|uniref:Acetylornithine aminotransferase n=1 Tax=Pontiella agarivorans TaxID=3038953 RepID=A0ABU5MZ87_9BACT|nr:aspartate aminotransferase family protein [Pontiella agarivorans]MDZ8119416.1 aspartate aminotransferase family protein [Pontiella agarivorans]
MTAGEIERLQKDYLMPTYAPGLALVEGAGAHVWDADGNEYLDFVSGIAVTNIGHCHPKMIRAVQDQVETLVHVSNLFYNAKQPVLAKKLAERSGLPGAKCFFSNSGAESNEGLIKLARLWGSEHGKYEIITMRQSFHGRTLATLTATGQEKVQTGFGPLPQGFVYATFNDIDSVEEAISSKTAAVLVEALQGEGGVIPADQEFLSDLRKLCDERGILLLCDEVQSGMGRTGKWFGFQNYDVIPDAFSLAKGLGNGVPIGAIVAGEKLADIFQPGRHATTFGGTPLACAAALSVIEVIEEEELLANTQMMGAYFAEGLCELAMKYKKWIAGVRGLGLLLGLVLDVPAAPLQKKLQEKGMLAIATAGNVLRLLPPLNVTQEEIDQALKLIGEACADLHDEMAEQSPNPCVCGEGE